MTIAVVPVQAIPSPMEAGLSGAGEEENPEAVVASWVLAAADVA